MASPGFVCSRAGTFRLIEGAKNSILVLNVPGDRDRLKSISSQISKFKSANLALIPGVQGALLPNLVCDYLTDNPYSKFYKGTLGCFMSHIRAWEHLAESIEPFMLVIEDDVWIGDLDILTILEFPLDCDLIFCNDRMSVRPLSSEEQTCELCSLTPSLEHLEAHGRPIGADGYILSPSGARKLLQFVAKDGLFSHVDVRMLAYCLSTSEANALPGKQRLTNNLKVLRSKYPEEHHLNARVLAPALTRHRPDLESRRQAQDDGLERAERSKPVTI